MTREEVPRDQNLLANFCIQISKSGTTLALSTLFPQTELFSGILPLLTFFFLSHGRLVSSALQIAFVIDVFTVSRGVFPLRCACHRHHHRLGKKLIWKEFLKVFIHHSSEVGSFFHMLLNSYKVRSPMCPDVPVLAPTSPFPIRGWWELLSPAPGHSELRQLWSSEQVRRSASAAVAGEASVIEMGD